MRQPISCPNYIAIGTLGQPIIPSLRLEPWVFRKIADRNHPGVAKLLIIGTIGPRRRQNKVYNTHDFNGVFMLREHEIEIRVRYQETDPMGYLHHANYFTYFEIGRTELLRASGGNYRRMEESGLLAVVVHAECRFRRPARYDDLLRVRTRIAKISPAKIEHEYEVTRDGQTLALGRVKLALVNREGEVQRVPEWMRDEG